MPGLQSHPHAEVVALCGRDLARTRALAERLHVPEITTDYRELCARKDLDAITIATPNACHAAQAQAAFAAGKHVFCEKPLGMSVRGSARDANGLPRAVTGCTRSPSPIVICTGFKVKRRVLQGDVGAPYYVRVKHESWEGLHPDAKVGFREKLDLGGGGVLYDVGSHLFDLVQFVFGPVHSVLGDMILVPRERLDPKTGALVPVETDDVVSAWFCCENGVHGHLFASRATPSSGEKAFIEVVGSQGALKASLSRGSVDVLSLSRPMHPAWERVPLPEGAADGPSSLSASHDGEFCGGLPSREAGWGRRCVVSRWSRRVSKLEGVQEAVRETGVDPAHR